MFLMIVVFWWYLTSWQRCVNFIGKIRLHLYCTITKKKKKKMMAFFYFYFFSWHNKLMIQFDVSIQSICILFTQKNKKKNCLVCLNQRSKTGKIFVNYASTKLYIERNKMTGFFFRPLFICLFVSWKTKHNKTKQSKAKRKEKTGKFKNWDAKKFFFGGKKNVFIQQKGEKVVDRLENKERFWWFGGKREIEAAF